MRQSRRPKTPFPLYTALAIAVTGFSMAGLAQDGVRAISTQDIDSLSAFRGQMDFISLDPIFFDFDKATLDARAKSTLDAAVRYILGRSEVYRIIIEGHADSKASEDYNYQLADRRAAAVRDYLADQGVAPHLFLIAGLGENFPVDEYWTREGQRRNRHVEVYIIERR